MKRVDVLREIAERYYELIDPTGRSGVPGSGDSCPQMPATYTPTVREFERLMLVMRKQAKQKAFHGHSLGKLRWHLLEWHVGAERIRRLEPIEVISNGKRRRLLNEDGTVKTRPVLVVRRVRDARQDRAELALLWMAENWGLQSEPMIPTELLEAAA